MNEEIEKHRCTVGQWATKKGANFGAFMIPSPIKSSLYLRVICSPLGEMEWDHVSVSLDNRCPNWPEMNKIKNLFFGEDVTVLQFHPKKSEYVNCHPYCLHLWKRVDTDHELPPSLLVGPKCAQS